jgi:hypothetical protein
MPHLSGLVVVLAAGVATGLSGCSLFANDPEESSTETPTPEASSSPSMSPVISPSTSPSAAPSVTMEPTEGPIVGAPAGAPVTPDIFLATVDEEAGLLRVVIMVPGIYEDGGSCVATVKAGSVTVSKENTGVADATSTACGQFTFALADLPPGNASVTARYESATHEGTSGATTVEIP